jgi:excisionase family DNA binding protein
MLTVPQAARRAGKDPETIRRWIRAGRLRSERVGTQHLIDEADLDELTGDDGSPPLPTAAFRKTHSGGPMPDFVKLLRESRDSR